MYDRIPASDHFNVYTPNVVGPSQDSRRWTIILCRILEKNDTRVLIATGHLPHLEFLERMRLSMKTSGRMYANTNDVHMLEELQVNFIHMFGNIIPVNHHTSVNIVMNRLPS